MNKFMTVAAETILENPDQLGKTIGTKEVLIGVAVVAAVTAIGYGIYRYIKRDKTETAPAAKS